MASFLFVLPVGLVCSLAVVGHGNHSRQESAFASWWTPRALLHIVHLFLFSIWKNIFNSKFSILCFDHVLSSYPTPPRSLLPTHRSNLCSVSKKGGKGGRKRKQTNEKQNNPSLAYPPHSRAGSTLRCRWLAPYRVFHWLSHTGGL